MNFVQRAIGVTADGVVGPKTRAGNLARTRLMQRVLKVAIDWDWVPQLTWGSPTSERHTRGLPEQSGGPSPRHRSLVAEQLLWVIRRLRRNDGVHADG